MEMEKRKRSVDGDADGDGRRRRMKEDEGDQPPQPTETATATATATATDEEVEEFYAILRRVHEVVRYFGKGKGVEGAEKKKGGRWKPSFQWEDFEEVNVHNNINKGREKIGDAEAVEENHVVPVVLDLNVEPEPVPEKI